jgi:hypothetical protein
VVRPAFFLAWLKRRADRSASVIGGSFSAVAVAVLLLPQHDLALHLPTYLDRACPKTAALASKVKWTERLLHKFVALAGESNRDLSRQDAERLATLRSGGVLRGSEGDEKVPDQLKRVQLKGAKPFAHPFYWAAFTLIGDPD